MKTRYRLIRRGNRSNAFYCVENTTGKRTSLRTSSEEEARQLIEAKNQAERQPVINLQIARSYLSAIDPAMGSRTWKQVVEHIISTKTGPTRRRWQSALKDKALGLILDQKLIETTADHFLQTLKEGTVSTNRYLRHIHNYALGMQWLPWAVLSRLQWPAPRFKVKRAITRTEHQAILEGERNQELRDYYEILWHIGGSQTDMASLTAENIDWKAKTISYSRGKTNALAIIHFGDIVREILQRRPATGFLFPMIAQWNESDRASIFSRRCRLVGVSGVTLHSYRYAWAERAMEAGYPERYAMQALGHTSRAIHRAYAKKAQVALPPLEEYEKRTKTVIVPLPIAANT